MSNFQRRALPALLLFSALASSARAGGGFDIDPAAIAGGGGVSSGGPYALTGTVGQQDVGLMGANRFAIVGGLWPMVSATTLAPCIGDCGGDGEVVVTELLTMVRLSISGAAPDDCESGDGDGNGRVSVDEVIVAVNRALSTCF
jgi:hypothetical protein